METKDKKNTTGQSREWAGRARVAEKAVPKRAIEDKMVSRAKVPNKAHA